MNQEELDEIMARAFVATPGPFVVFLHGESAGFTVNKTLPNTEVVADWMFNRKDDAVFVANARNDIMALLVEIHRLRDIPLRFGRK